MAKVQVDKTHYDFGEYVNVDRWNSYYYQLKEVMASDGKDVLLIGVGDGIVSDLLTKFGCNVTTFDFDEKLNPDVVGSVTSIDEILDNKYDVIICCQVLEHIPFDMFAKTVERISKCVKDDGEVILSLPNHYLRWNFRINIPKLPEANAQILSPRLFQHNWDVKKDGNGEHYWEIGAKGSSRKKIRNILKKYFNIKKEFLPDGNMYHIFFVLEK